MEHDSVTERPPYDYRTGPGREMKHAINFSGVFEEHSGRALFLTGHNFCSVHSITIILWYSERPEKTLSDGIFSTIFLNGPILRISPLIAHGFLPKMGPNWPLILLYHLKEHTLSYWKNKTKLISDHFKKSYGLLNFTWICMVTCGYMDHPFHVLSSNNT